MGRQSACSHFVASQQMVNQSMPDKHWNHIPGALPGDFGPDGDHVTCGEHSGHRPCQNCFMFTMARINEITVIKAPAFSSAF